MANSVDPDQTAPAYICNFVRHLSVRNFWLLDPDQMQHSVAFDASLLFIQAYMTKYLLCFRHLSKSRFLLGALIRRSKFANFCHDLMQNHLS